MNLLNGGFWELFNPLSFVKHLTFWAGGGSGGGSTTAYTQTSNVPSYLKEEYQNLIGQAQQQIYNIDAQGNITGFKSFVPYSANPADYVAGFSPLQDQAFSGIANLSVPSQFGQATDLAQSAGMGGINSAQQAYNYGGQGAQYGQLGAEYGAQGAQYGNLGAEYGAQGSQLGQLGAEYGAQGAGYGDLAAQIGQMGLQAQGLGEDISAQSQNYAAQQAAAGQNYANMATNPYAVQAYMSPYQQAVIDVAKQAAVRDYDIQRQTRQATAAKAGAFGGSRQAIEEAEAQKALNAQLQSIEATGMQTAYNNALQSMQYGSTLGSQGLAGAQTGLGTALQGGQLGLSGIGTALQGLQGGMQGANVGISGAQAGMQGAGLGIQGAQAGMQGAGLGIQGAQAGMQGSQVGLQGVSGAQAGYGLANQAAGQLTSTGQAQNQAQMNILNAQLQAGNQQQQQQQNIINQAVQNYASAQAYPQEQLTYLSGLIHGTPGAGSVTQQYMPNPSLLGTIGSLGAMAYGASQLGTGRAEGGIVKLAKGGMVQSYSSGGDVMSRDNVERIAEGLSIPQLQQAMQNKTVDEYIGIPLLAQKQQEQQQAQMMQAQAQSQQGIPTIKDRVMQGVDTLPSNLYKNQPVVRAAQGGIVAFNGEEGSYVKHIAGVPQFPYSPEPMNTGYTYDIMQQAINPATGKPWTEEEIYNKQRAQEAKYNIDTGIYAKMREENVAERTKLDKEAKDIAGTSWMMGGLKGLGARTWQEALSKIGEGYYGYNIPATKEYKQNLKDLKKEDRAMTLSEQNMKMAQMSGDTSKFESAQNRYNTAATNYQSALNENTKLRNQAELKTLEEEYGYKKDIDKQRIASASAHDTDLRDTTNIIYRDLVAKGAPANDATMALARTNAANLLGKQPGSSVLDLKAQIAYKDWVDDVNQRTTERLGKDLTYIRLQATEGTLKAKAARTNSEADLIAYNKAAKETETYRNKVKADIKADLPSPFESAPTAEPKAAPTSAPAVVSPKGKSGQSLIEDGYVFPSKEKLEAYREAKKKAQSSTK